MDPSLFAAKDRLTPPLRGRHTALFHIPKDPMELSTTIKQIQPNQNTNQKI